MYKYILIYAFIAGLLFPFASHAQQKHFYKHYAESGIEFNYQWLTAQGPRELTFSIPHEDIESLPDSAPAYNPMLAQNFVQRKLLEYAKSVDPRVARIIVKRVGGALEMGVSGSSQKRINEITAELTKQHTQAEADYLAKNYYVPFYSELGQSAIKQDHKRYASESSDKLNEVVVAIKKQLNNPNSSKEFINFTLNWLQTIPYDTLENRTSSNGSGFAAPKQLLLNNKGDCDSKSTLFLALLKAYNPNLSANMIFLPSHALVGINIKPEKTDITIMQDNLNYVLAEPTGSAQYRLGEISPSSEMAIRNRQYTTELF
jgi:hypothetical protein